MKTFAAAILASCVLAKESKVKIDMYEDNHWTFNNYDESTDGNGTLYATMIKTQDGAVGMTASAIFSDSYVSEEAGYTGNLEMQIELHNGNWRDNNWVSVYFSVPDPENPGMLQTSMTTVQFRPEDAFTSAVDQRNFYGNLKFDAASVGSLDNFSVLNARDQDPYGPWFASTNHSKDFRTMNKEGKYCQLFTVSRSLHQDI